MRGDEQLHALQAAAKHARSTPEHGQGEQHELVGREECAPVRAQQHDEAVREADSPAPPRARHGALRPCLERFSPLQARLLDLFKNIYIYIYSYMHMFKQKAQISTRWTRTDKLISTHTLSRLHKYTYKNTYERVKSFREKQK